jgi:hypothetical protein
MSLPAVYTGFWYDESRPAILGATVTLPIRLGNILVAALSTLVTIAATFFWIIIAFAVHQIIIRNDFADVLDLQRQLILRNSGSASGALWEAFKLHRAWRKKTANLTSRVVVVALPALLILLTFTAASVLVAEVATRSYEQVQVLVKPQNCGLWQYDSSQVNNSDAAGTATRKIRNDTIDARTYARNWYANESSGVAARSLFPVLRLPYSFNTSSTCPFGHGGRCIPDDFSAITMDTGLLDSHAMFGINAPDRDRVSFRMKVTCSPVHAKDLAKDSRTAGIDYLDFYFGPIPGVTPYTYRYVVHAQYDAVGYYLT